MSASQCSFTTGSSTAVTHTVLGVSNTDLSTEATSSAPCVDLNLSHDLLTALAQLNVDITFNEAFIPESWQAVSIITLKKMLKKIHVIRETEKLTEEQLATLEEYRLQIMLAVCEQIKLLEHRRPPIRIVPLEEDEASSSFLHRAYSWLKENCPWLIKAAFGLSFLLGFTFEAIFYYVGFAEMLVGLIPSMINPVMIVLSLILTALNLIFYVAFDGSMLGEMFGIMIGEDEKKKLEACDKQTTVVNEINRLLNDTSLHHNIPLSDYSAYTSFSTQCNRVITDRQDKFTDCLESSGRKWVRWGITILGALLTLGSGYFSGVAILPALALTLASPWGAAFVGVLMISMFIAYFAMQGKGIAHLLSPNLDKKIEVRKHLNEFHPKEKEDYQHLIQQKRESEVAVRSVVGDKPKLEVVEVPVTAQTGAPEIRVSALS